VHVLQTFFSEQEADEVQIKGRTARQGKKGTYSLVLLQAGLKVSCGLKANCLRSVAHASRYQKLDEGRKAVRAAACIDIETDLKEAIRLDKMTREYFDVLLGAQRADAMRRFEALFKELRPRESHGGGSYHVMFLMDTSGSMREDDATPGAQFAAVHNNRLGCALEACDSFVRTRANAGAADVVTLIQFESEASAIFHAKPLRPQMITEQLNYNFKSGGTNFSAAFEQAINHRLDGYSTLIMFLTDGYGGNPQNEIDILRADPSVSMKAIGFGAGAAHGKLKEIASTFGEQGEHISAISAVELVGSFQAAAAELSHVGKTSK